MSISSLARLPDVRHNSSRFAVCLATAFNPTPDKEDAARIFDDDHP